MNKASPARPSADTNQAIRVLLVEDNPGDARLVEMALAEVQVPAFEVTRTERLEQALQLLGGHFFDAVLLDLSLPDSHGLDTVDKVGAADPAVPIVVLSGTLDEELAFHAVQHGAQDYLVKGQGDAYLVSRSVRYAIERKRAADALRHHEQLLAEAERLTGVGSWAWDIVTGEVEWSEESYRIFGVRPERDTPSYELFMQRVHPDDRQAVERALNQALGGAHYNVVHRIVWPDGTVRTVQQRGNVEFDPSGRARRMVGAAQDITESKEAEQFLRRARDELERRVEERTAHLAEANRRLQEQIGQRKQAEKKLRQEWAFSSAVLDTVGALVVVLDRNGRIVGFNRACEEVSGYSFEDAQGKTVWDLLLTPEETEGVRQVFANLRDTQIPNHHENHWRTRSGALRFIAWSNTVLRNEAGEVDHVIATGIDITERRESENALRESERQLRLITDTVPVLISYVDSQRRYRFNNRAYEEWFGDAREDIEGCLVPDVIGKEAYGAIERYIERALAGEYVTFESVIPYRRCGERFVSVSYIPDFGSGGEVRGFFAMITDVTDRREAEQRDKQRLLQLAHASRLSTMGEMATELAHELNQPLTAIASYGDSCRRLLESGKAKDEQLHEAMTEINAQALRAGEVIRRMRSFARKETAQQSYLDLNELIREMHDLTEVEARWNEVTVSWQLGTKLPSVRVDRILIEQVILNLVRNAIDAMEQVPERRLEIKTWANDDQSVEFAVSDTGPGLKPEELERVFEAFYTTKDTGMGMGLAISQSIVESHGGQLWALANPEGGATFGFRLPVAETIGEENAV